MKKVKIILWTVLFVSLVIAIIIIALNIQDDKFYLYLKFLILPAVSFVLIILIEIIELRKLKKEVKLSKKELIAIKKISEWDGNFPLMIEIPFTIKKDNN